MHILKVGWMEKKRRVSDGGRTDGVDAGGWTGSVL